MFGRKLNPFCDYQTDADFVTLDANALKERMVEMSSVLFPAIGNLSKRSVNKAQLAFIKKFGKQISKDPFPVNSSVMIVDPVRSSKNEPYYLGPFKLIQRNTIDDQDTYVVDKILKHKGPATKRSYFVKWKHYDSFIILGSKPLILLIFQSSTPTGLQYPLPIWEEVMSCHANS
ncbi:hypothetical protein BASA50_005472 [Batrachochytrium salamandrivorans]|uniref:Chromo domain-containing protein n=1 Tax=Batrachochytrium salamandrivorans TaxID=1357716 RepID=A0ABQ8FCQ4_9FUNG|nr:hypothetical protein BASA50_005472 [Batrachochytrium salamandrivorans]